MRGIKNCSGCIETFSRYNFRVELKRGREEEEGV